MTEPIDPSEVLSEARAQALSGDHEAALEKLIWFHHNALSLDPGLYGVRLSFALGHWMDLARSYPPALDALIQVRDAKAMALRSGSQDHELFNDLRSINRELKEEYRTYELFRELAAADQSLAAACFPWAIQSVVQSEDWELAAEFLGDPAKVVSDAITRLNRTVSRVERITSDYKVVRRWAEIRNCGNEIALILRALRGCGRTQEADSLRSSALAEVESESWRTELGEELSLLEAGRPGLFPDFDDEGKITGFRSRDPTDA